jgi:replicative DNA helicase
MANNHSKTKNSFRVPPQNVESEKALLGSIMMRPGAIYEVIDIITPRSFYSEKHKIIFETMLELIGKNEPIDFLTMSARLKEKGLLEAIGGSVYLTELVNYVPSSANIRQYATIVHNKYLMRGLLEAAEYITSLGYDEAVAIDELLDRAEKRVYEVANFQKHQKFVELKDILGEAWERLDRLHKSKDDLRGVPTGFRELDNKLAGLQKSDLIILASRPSMGKTSLALDIARQAAVQHDVPVCIFSLEMSSHQLVDRMLSAESRVNSWNIRTGKHLIDSDFDRIRDSLDKLARAPIFVDDQPGNSIIKMRSVARRLKSEKNLGLVIVDYLQLMLPADNRASDSMVQQVTEISRSLKNMARELNVPVLALSQLSRAVEQRGGKPRLSDLRDSGSIEQDADVVMFIHREDKYNENSDKPNIAEILIEKHRNGPTGKVELYFDQERTTFVSLEKGNLSDFGAASVASAPDEAGL